MSHEAFFDPRVVARYAEAPPWMVPGFADLQRMAWILLAERAPYDAQVLVLGAGGGLEIKAFAEAQPCWSFVGIDPSAPMLDLARVTLGNLSACTQLHQGLINSAPEGPFDAATCILTLHFIEREERLRTLKEVRRRLRPGAPFVVAHFSFPQGCHERDVWLARYAAFAISSGIEPSMAKNAQARIGACLPILAPEDDEQLLRDAGFNEINPFYMSFAFRGWVAYA
jgi:tRNA (cmo5U34)-methyltransferase